MQSHDKHSSFSQLTQSFQCCQCIKVVYRSMKKLPVVGLNLMILILAWHEVVGGSLNRILIMYHFLDLDDLLELIECDYIRILKSETFK